MTRFSEVIVFVVAGLLTAISWVDSCAGVEPDHKDLIYAVVNGTDLKLDIYLPSQGTGHPLIVWVHGGAWRSGSKDSVQIIGLLKHGYAIASVDYRLSPVAKFPAQVHDIKAAIRFLRSQSAKYSINPQRVIIAGASAGGHLAALVGVSNNAADLEGQVGEHLSESSAVQQIVSFYGASNLQTILSQSTPHGLNVRIPALKLLLGGLPADYPEIAKLASPVAHVDATDPPLLLIHGDQDPQMPINQAHELHGRYRDLKRPVEFDVVYGGAHGGAEFFSEERLARVAEFLNQSHREAAQE